MATLVPRDDAWCQLGGNHSSYQTASFCCLRDPVRLSCRTASKRPHYLGVKFMKICAKSVFGSVVLMQVFGALWYSKFAFFASWAAAQGKTPEQLVPTALPFVFSITSSILASYGIAW